MTPFDPNEGLDAAISTLTAAGIDIEAFRSRLARSAAPRLESVAAPPTPSDDVGPLGLAAAMRGYFLPSDLGLSAPENTKNAGLESLLAQSEVVSIGMQRAWRLKPDSRRKILLQASRSGTLSTAVAAAESSLGSTDTRDGEGKFLRAALTGKAPDLDQLSIEELQQVVHVSEWVGGTDLTQLPASVELRRAVQQRELLDPFRQLVGRSVPAGSDGNNDRFVGRAEELERLRAYVGIVEPEELKHYLTRGLSSLWSTLTLSDAGNDPLLIRGLGGMGKSTLIAKFMLDHALIPGVRLPFVYLDFDRAALAPRQPMQLLIDIALQIEVWFPEIELSLREFRSTLRTSIDGQAGDETRRRREETTRSELRACCQQFRKIIESFNNAHAPVIVLFDTFEVVQYDDAAVQGVLSLINALTDRDGKDPWSNLRIVVAGRAEIPEIKTRLEPIKLSRLSPSGTRDLVMRRNETEAIGLAPEQIDALAEPLQGSPLDVIIVTNWLKTRAPGERAALIEEIVSEFDEDASQSSSDTRVASLRVTGILVKRMIGHINDPEVRQLVDPGLVVRYVTPKVIREVMAPASGLVKTPDELPAGAEDELFRRLGQERWLVDQRGGVIRHNPEVRSAMLSLMRLRNKEKFEATNERAVQYFFSQAKQDRAARAEAVYHMVLRDHADFAQVDKIWSPDLGPLLAGAVDDLAGQSQTYLKARLGRSVRSENLAALPTSSVGSVLMEQGRRILDQYTPEAVVGILRAGGSAINDDLLSVKLEALYRAGRWVELAEMTRAMPSSDHGGMLTQIIGALQSGTFDRNLMSIAEVSDATRFLLRWATRDQRAAQILLPLNMDIVAWGNGLTQLFAKFDAFWDYAAFACAGASTPNGAEPSAAALEVAEELCGAVKRLPATANDGGALRVLAIFDPDERARILQRVDFVSHFSTLSVPEVRAFERLIDDPAVFSAAAQRDSVNPDQLRETLRRGRALRAQIAKQAADSVIADPAITREFAGVIVDLTRLGGPQAARIVRGMLALTHPDWLEPLGNALTRAFHGDVPAKLDRWSTIKRYWGSKVLGRRPTVPSTGYELLSLADEAGDLPAAVTAYFSALEGQSDGDAQDFIAMAHDFQNWGHMLIRTVGDGAATATA